MTKRKSAGWVARPVKVPVANTEAFAVDGVRGMAKALVTRVVFEDFGPSDREFARGVVVAKERVGDSRAALIATKEGLNHGRSLSEPGQLHRHAALIDNYGVRLDSEHRPYEVIGSAGQFDVRPVVTFRFPFAIGADDENGGCR